MIPRLSPRQRQVFSAVYAAPGLTPAQVARQTGLSTANACEVLALLEFRGLLTRAGRAWHPAEWTVAA